MELERLGVIEVKGKNIIDLSINKNFLSFQLCTLQMHSTSIFIMRLLAHHAISK